MARIAALLGALFALGIGCLPGGASACACGEAKGLVVARGKSLYGVPWRIRADGPSRDSLGRRGVQFSFEMLPPAFSGVGYSVGMVFPIPSSFVFTGTAGSNLSRHPEGDLSGVTSRKVAMLIVKMSKGEDLKIVPEPALPGPVKRHPWLGGLRFYDQFFAAGSKPLKVTAIDVKGNILASRASSRGSFFG